MAPLHVVLLAPEIHWNTGNIGRTCLAAKAELHLVEPLGFSIDDKAVRRAGLDYWPHVDPTIWPDWASLEAALAQLGPPTVVSPDATRLHWEADLRGPSTLIFGRESVGLPAALRARYADHSVRIPMSTTIIRSLNLSTCVGIMLAEALRQREWQGDPP